MRRTVSAAIIVIGGAVAALLFGPNGPWGGFWRPIAMNPEPAGWQLAGLMSSGLTEAVGFGLALAILALGRPAFTRLTATPAKATVAQLASAWLLGSWWPHTALHMHHGAKASALVGIELGFHANSILAVCVLLWAVAATGRRTADPSAV